MAQLRHDYEKFQALNTEVLVMVPNGLRSIEKHISRHNPPHPVLSDKGSLVARQYQIAIRQTPLIKFAVMTITLFVVDRAGSIRYAYYPRSYIEEPANGPVLAVLSQLAKAEPTLPARH
jgi:peroxiredoxin